MLTSHNINLSRLKSELEEFLPLLKNMKIGILDGPISQEDIIYNPTANPEDLEITSIKKCFDGLNLTYDIIDPSKNNWLEKIMQCNPIIINIHGEYGEDGRIQGLLDIMGKSYIGSDLENSAISIAKPLFKLISKSLGFKTPKFFKEGWANTPTITKFHDLNFPIMAKLSNGGCSIGMQKIHDAEELDSFLTVNKKGLHKYFFEEYIDGRFLTVGILQVKDDILTFPPLEVITKNGFYDEAAKKDHDNSGAVQYVFPSDALCMDGGELQKFACDIFQKTGASNFARVDFIVDKNDEAWLLELNTIAGLSSTGNYASSGKEIGLTYDEIVLNILKSSLENTPYKNATSSKSVFGTAFVR